MFKQTQRLRYVQIINVWSRSRALFCPGHELYKQVVELAFHVKKVGYKYGIRTIFSSAGFEENVEVLSSPGVVVGVVVVGVMQKL